MRDFLSNFLSNLALMSVIGLGIIPMFTGEAHTLPMSGDAVGVYKALGILPFMVILLVLAAIHRTERSGDDRCRDRDNWN